MDSPPITGGEKLRLMISYGGHILPRPHDKSLCYVGGETRLIAVPRHATATLSTLTTHLTKTLHHHHHNNNPFTLKYQLPSHDLDSLISISTSEDLSNMLDEYDRLSSSHALSRIRFFLFPTVDNSSPLLHDLKTDGWFFDALRTAGVKQQQQQRHGSGDSVPESISVDEKERDKDKSSSFGSTGSSSYTPAVRAGDDGGAPHFHDVKLVLPSLDSLGSDSSIPSPNFSQQAIVYQDASCFPESVPVSATFIETEINACDCSPRSDLLTPVQVSNYILSKPVDQPPLQAPSPPPAPRTPPPHFIHYPVPQHDYITQYYPGSFQVASYPSVYQPYVQALQPVHYQTNKPFPVYMMPVGLAHNPYDVSMQYPLANSQSGTPAQPQVASNPVVTPIQPQVASNPVVTPIQPQVASNPVIAPIQPQVPSSPVMAASQMGYEGCKAAAPALEYAANAYRTTAVVAQPVIASDDHHHHQVVALPPINPSSQPVAVSPPENTSYVNEYDDTLHAQIYKTQPSGPALSSQFPTTTNAATILSESLKQLQVEDTKH